MEFGMRMVVLATVILGVLLLFSATRMLALGILAPFGKTVAGSAIWIVRTLWNAHRDLAMHLIWSKDRLFDSLANKLEREEEEKRERLRKRDM